MPMAASLALASTPKARLRHAGSRVDLDTLVPEQFGNWRIDETIAPVKLSPGVQAKLDAIYNQTLSRTYIDSGGQRIMMSIAYGSGQSDAMAVLKPEVCYPAQGFEIIQLRKGNLEVAGVGLPVVRLIAQHKNRLEPITYWSTVGGQPVTGGPDRKLAQLCHGLAGSNIDSSLVRLSSIHNDAPLAYALHTSFTGELFQALNPHARGTLFGEYAAAQLGG